MTDKKTTKKQPDNGIRTYRCHQGHNTVTKIIDKGNVPHTIECQNSECKFHARLLPETDQKQNHTHEWFKPDNAQMIVKEKELPGSMDFYKNGGLMFRVKQQ